MDQERGKHQRKLRDKYTEAEIVRIAALRDDLGDYLRPLMLRIPPGDNYYEANYILFTTLGQVLFGIRADELQQIRTKNKSARDRSTFCWRLIADEADSLYYIGQALEILGEKGFLSPLQAASKPFMTLDEWENDRNTVIRKIVGGNPGAFRGAGAVELADKVHDAIQKLIEASVPKFLRTSSASSPTPSFSSAPSFSNSSPSAVAVVENETGTRTIIDRLQEGYLYVDLLKRASFKKEFDIKRGIYDRATLEHAIEQLLGENPRLETTKLEALNEALSQRLREMKIDYICERLRKLPFIARSQNVSQLTAYQMLGCYPIANLDAVVRKAVAQTIDAPQYHETHSDSVCSLVFEKLHTRVITWERKMWDKGKNRGGN
jgi:hypothetical protein